MDYEQLNYEIRFNDSTVLRVVKTPGHSKGSVTLFNAKWAFTGDTLFATSIGRTDLEGGNLGELRNSIRILLGTLESSCAVLPGHGEIGTVKSGRKYWERY